MTLKLSNNMIEIPLNPIRHARVKYGLTQQQLSDVTGIPRRSIENWEGGKRKCPEYLAKMVVNLLDQKFGKPDHQTILEEILDMLKGDLKYAKSEETQMYIQNLIGDIEDSLK